jgi:hypothetical protein
MPPTAVFFLDPALGPWYSIHVETLELLVGAVTSGASSFFGVRW